MLRRGKKLGLRLVMPPTFANMSFFVKDPFKPLQRVAFIVTFVTCLNVTTTQFTHLQ